MKSRNALLVVLWVGGLMNLAPSGGRADPFQLILPRETVFAITHAPLQVLSETEAVVAAGTELLVEELQGEWAWVSVKGWVPCNYVQPLLGDGRLQPGDTVVTQSDTPLKVVSEIRALVPAGKKLSVEQVEGDWLWVAVHGWCQLRYLSKEPVVLFWDTELAPSPPEVDYEWEQDRGPNVWYSSPYLYSYPYRSYYRYRAPVWSDVNFYIYSWPRYYTHGWPGRSIYGWPGYYTNRWPGRYPGVDPHYPHPPRDDLQYRLWRMQQDQRDAERKLRDMQRDQQDRHRNWDREYHRVQEGFRQDSQRGEPSQRTWQRDMDRFQPNRFPPNRPQPHQVQPNRPQPHQVQPKPPASPGRGPLNTPQPGSHRLGPPSKPSYSPPSGLRSSPSGGSPRMSAPSFRSSPSFRSPGMGKPAGR